MSIFSLKWFKSQKEKNLEALKVEEQTIKNEILRYKLEEKMTNSINAETKPYRSLRLVNDVLTVVFNDGSVVTKQGATQSDFVNVKTSVSENEVLSFFRSKTNKSDDGDGNDLETIKKVKREVVKKHYDVLLETDDFKVVDGALYITGINRSVPELLAEKFIEIVKYYSDRSEYGLQQLLDADEEYQSLKRFFMWCCLNPRAEVADKLYDFLMKNSFRITKQGFFVALRNVVTVEGTDNELVHFVSNAYNKVKAVWKKNPDNFRVLKNENGDYSLEKTTNSNPQGEIIGNLTTLYLDLPNMKDNRFTDDYTRTFDIRVGRVVNMPPEECSWSTADCAEKGLHFTSDQIHYVGCGDTSVLILINPMKVVGIGEHKGRCYEYLPIMTVPREEATEILHDLDFDTLQLDESYAVNQLTNLEEKAKEGFTAETKKYNFNLSAISSSEMNNIIDLLQNIKNEIKGRIQPIV